MKRVDLKTALAKFRGQKVRFEAKFTMVSKPYENGKRKVLIENISVNNEILVDHLWVEYSHHFNDFIATPAGQMITFVGRVTNTGVKRLGMTKYTIKEIDRLTLTKDYVKKDKSKPENTNQFEDSRKFINLMPASKTKYFRVNAIVAGIGDGQILLKDIETLSESINIEVDLLWVTVSEFIMSRVKKGYNIEADIKVKEIFSEDKSKPPVKASKMKNLTII